MDLTSFAKVLGGARRLEGSGANRPTNVSRIAGTAITDSADGRVLVDLDAQVFSGDGSQYVELDTSDNVRKGDRVYVDMVGADGKGKSLMISGATGSGDRQQGEIDSAANAAEVAWDWADEAHTAATDAQASASAAARAAGDAQTSADAAAESARTANQNATKAIGDAAAASAAATAAQGSADSAAESARTAQQTAEAAQQSANTAQGAANAAQASANAANAHATAALNSLSTVEDVVDTLTWITEHGTMAKTTDTAVDPSKVYFVRDNNGDYTVGGNRYSIVQEPVASDLSSYYELTIDKSVENYIATHLSVTNEGLWLTPTQSGGYRVLVATGGAGKTYPTAGTYIIDGSGKTVAQFAGTGISFADDRTFYIGDESAYIFFDGNGHINIGGSNVTIGGSTTLAELLAKYDATITSDDISVSKTGGTATITVGGDTVTISDGAAGAQGPKGDTGDQGPQGPKGNDGTSVTVSRVEYGTSASAGTQPSSWSTTVPTSIAKGQWLWAKTSYSDGTDATTKSYVGTDGEDGTSVFVQSATKSGDTTTVVIADSEGHTSTLTIKDGTDGTNGQNGQNGLTGYVHTAWANSADGSTDFSTTASAGKSYLGVYTDNTAADSQTYSDYSWSLIKGAKGDQGETGPQGPAGKGISSITEYYALSNSTSAPSDSSFSTGVKTPTASNRYVWNYELITYTDSSTSKTAKHIAATYGETGSAGKGISSIVDYYAVNNSTTAPADSAFSTTISNPTATNRYLWNYELTTYSDTSTAKTAKRIIGVYGEKGETGETGPQGPAGHSPAVTTTKNSDGSVTIYVDGTATSTVDAGEDGQTPTVTTTKNSDGSVTIYVNGTASNTVEAGADGTSYYTYVRYSANASGSGMVTTPTSATKYLGVYTGTSSSVPAYTSFKWSKYVGEDGSDADPLTVTSHLVDYQLSTSGTTAPTGTWSTTPLAPTTTQYLWTRTTLKFSDSTESVSYSVGGKAGTNGQNGTNGTDGGRWYAGTKITGISTTATVFSGSGIAAAVVGDMYLNTSTYNTYRCTVAGNASTAKWAYIANIKGQTGAQGPQGETGPQGPQGPQGETGSAGTNGVSVTGVEHQYYLSTSSTSQTGGSWAVKPAAYVRGRYYWERWKVSFSSGDPTYTTATLAEEVTSAWTAIESNEDAIALKANSSDVYTKSGVDGLISTEVTNRNAAITAKANEITSSVSETYATKTTVNGKADASDVTALAGRVTTAESNITQNAQNIELKVSKDGVISSINQSAESVKIQASKVEIDGTAVFSAISSDVDSAITNKGYATTTQAQGYATTAKSEAISAAATDATTKANAAEANAKAYTDALEIGGRNLVVASKLSNGYLAGSGSIGGMNATRKEGYSDYIPVSPGESITFQAWVTLVETGVEYLWMAYEFYNSSKTYIGSRPAKNHGTTLADGRIYNSFDGIVVPDGAAYIRVSMRRYDDGVMKVERGNKATDWTPAPEDIEANAVKRTQRIWYRKSAAGAPATPGTASSNWVTKADDGNDAWTKMHIAISSTHKYIYTCEQYEMADGTVGYTSVLLDNTITVIDGGNIITGSVTANKLNASDINASKKLTVGAMTDAAASTILNSNVQVGGRNLLTGTDVWLTTFNSYSSCGKSSETIPAGSVVTVSVEVNADNLVWDTTSSTHRIGFETYLTKTGGGYQYLGVWAGNAISEASNVVEAFTGSIHKRISKTFTLLGDFEVGMSGYIYTQGVAQGTVKVGRAKIEYGNKATDWTPAPEDVDAAVSDAAKTATNYVTEVNGDGVWVTPSDAKPVNGAAASTTSGWHISDALELFRKGVSMFKAYVEDSAAKVRIGAEDSGHIVLDPDGMDFRDGATSVARLARIAGGAILRLGEAWLTSGKTADVRAYVDSDSWANCAMQASHGQSGYGTTTAEVVARARLNSSQVYMSARELTVNDTYGTLRGIYDVPMGHFGKLVRCRIDIAFGTITVPANSRADITLDWQSGGFDDTNYIASITPMAFVNGFNNVAYCVSNRAADKVTVSAWNSNSYAVTQLIGVIGVDSRYGTVV